jgi:hypothetical protein
MKMLAVTACCAFLAGCATYVPPQQSAAVLVTRDSMRTYRPLPREERRVDICTMTEQNKAVICR